MLKVINSRLRYRLIAISALSARPARRGPDPKCLRNFTNTPFYWDVLVLQSYMRGIVGQPLMSNGWSTIL